MPTWIIVSALLAVAGAGAGTILGEGGISGKIPTLIGQGLIAGKPIIASEGGGFSNDQSFTSVDDDGTRITAAIEVNTGDKYKIQVPMLNKSNSNMVVHMTMTVPLGLTVDVDSDGSDDSDATGVGNVTRVGLTEWVFDLASNTTAPSVGSTLPGSTLPAPPTPTPTVDNLEIMIAHADDSPPGFFELMATLKQAAN